MKLLRRLLRRILFWKKEKPLQFQATTVIATLPIDRRYVLPVLHRRQK
jgi:hypothetical protein